MSSSTVDEPETKVASYFLEILEPLLIYKKECSHGKSVKALKIPIVESM